MYSVLKRFFDFFLAFLFLIIISPVFLLLMILVRCNMGSPIFFKQERTTKGKRTFNIIKFRTMTDSRDENGDLLPDIERQTKFGGFLRSSSLDELPELLNIIKGDMSIIGPRPLPPIYNDYYYKAELNRFKVRSGLIPPDSIDPNPIVSWDKQFEYEAQYADKVSFGEDIKILFGVFRILLKRNTGNYGEYIRAALNVERNNQTNYE